MYYISYIFLAPIFLLLWRITVKLCLLSSWITLLPTLRRDNSNQSSHHLFYLPTSHSASHRFFRVACTSLNQSLPLGCQSYTFLPIHGYCCDNYFALFCLFSFSCLLGLLICTKHATISPFLSKQHTDVNTLITS